jgi:hypothetical protein
MCFEIAILMLCRLIPFFPFRRSDKNPKSTKETTDGRKITPVRCGAAASLTVLTVSKGNAPACQGALAFGDLGKHVSDLALREIDKTSDHSNVEQPREETRSV